MHKRLWLVRHAQPAMAAGICYGGLDVPAQPDATQASAQRLAACLPRHARMAHSTLQRCELLALSVQALRPDLVSKPDARLRELDFGAWEGRVWDGIAPADLEAWTSDFANHRPGGGENLAHMMARVSAALHEVRQDNAAGSGRDWVWITHAGVVRCAQWLQMHGDGLLPQADQWPIAAPGWGQWVQMDLGQ